jgi:hypothetical protein
LSDVLDIICTSLQRHFGQQMVDHAPRCFAIAGLEKYPGWIQ